MIWVRASRTGSFNFSKELPGSAAGAWDLFFVRGKKTRALFFGDGAVSLGEGDALFIAKSDYFPPPRPPDRTLDRDF